MRFAVARVPKAIIKHFRSNGILRGVSIIVNVLRNRMYYSITDWRFNRKYGVDTRSDIAVQGEEELAVYAVRYQAIPPSHFHDALRRLQVDYRQFSFYDLGCGKGRALLLANDYGFESIVGVEYVPALAETAETNLQLWACKKGDKSRMSVVLGDASAYSFPKNPSVIFLNNPFRGMIMEKVVKNILSIASKCECYVLYMNPMQDVHFRNDRLFERLWCNKNSAGYYLTCAEQAGRSLRRE